MDRVRSLRARQSVERMAEGNLLIGKYFADDKEEAGKRLRAAYEPYVRSLIAEGNGARRESEHCRDAGREPAQGP